MKDWKKVINKLFVIIVINKLFVYERGYSKSRGNVFIYMSSKNIYGLAVYYVKRKPVP